LGSKARISVIEAIVEPEKKMDVSEADSVESRTTVAHAPPRPKRRRMLAEDREEFILREATVYFAEQGLSAGTIELARRIGITQPLLYKYFPTKEALIERVYERLLPQNWDPTWGLLLEDDSIPLRQRLRDFYTDYALKVLTYEHVRLFLFSGLSNNDFNSRYYSVLSKRILERIARAMRAEYSPSRKSRSVTKDELELVQSLHAAVYHLAFRRWVHKEQMNGNLAEMIAQKVDFFLDGARPAFERFNAEKKRPAPAK
jgi:AcrR family transcriptional regulator